MGLRGLVAWRVMMVVCTLVLAAVAGSAGALAQSGKPQALVYVFRAMGGKFVTKDMDTLAERIRAGGHAVTINNYTNFGAPAKEAIRLYKAAAVKPRIIALGYSAGGDAAIRFSLALKRAGVPVDLIITLDPTRIANRVPGNVKRFVNLYSSDHTMGGGDPRPARDYKGHFATIDLKDYTDAVHLDMGGLVDLQEAMAAKIEDVVAMPDPGTGGVPITYVPPKGEALVIWDTGVAVNAAAGETVAQVATQYGVPAWAVASINKVSETKPLAAGQRLVVPRRLVAP